MSRLLVNGKEPNRGDEKIIRKQLKSLYKDDIIELSLQFRFERNITRDQLTQEKEKWKKLKEWIKDISKSIEECADLENVDTHQIDLKLDMFNNILDKMQELEKGETK